MVYYNILGIFIIRGVGGFIIRGRGLRPAPPKAASLDPFAVEVRGAGMD